MLVVQDKHININKYFIDNELAVYQEVIELYNKNIEYLRIRC